MNQVVTKTQLADIVSGIGLSQVYVANDPSRMHISNYANTFDHPRFIVCLQGVRHHRFISDGKIQEVALQPGQALLVCPGCQLEMYYVEDATVLHINLCEHFSLFKYSTFEQAIHNSSQEKIYNFMAPVVIHVPNALLYPASLLLDYLKTPIVNAYPTMHLARLAECLLFHIQQLLLTTTATKSSKAKMTWLAICAYVDEHCQDPINRESVSETFRLNPNHVSRLFQQFSPIGFTRYLTNRRMEVARRMLVEHAEMHVSEIAAMSGFPNPKHFNKLFKQIYGTNPTGYRSLHA